VLFKPKEFIKELSSKYNNCLTHFELKLIQVEYEMMMSRGCMKHVVVVRPPWESTIMRENWKKN